MSSRKYRDATRLEASFVLTVIDGCSETVPYIIDKSGGVLNYTPFSGYTSFEDKIYLRSGLGQCFRKLRKLLTCYDDDTYRRRSDCPHQLLFEDRADSFGLSINLDKDAIQYIGMEVHFQILFISETNAYQRVRAEFRLVGFCEGAKILHMPFNEKKTFSVYAYDELRWSYSFYMQDPNCGVRFEDEIVVTHTCFASEAMVDQIRCPSNLGSEDQAAILQRTGGSARQKGTFYLRATGKHIALKTQGYVDYVLELVDVCQFENMTPTFAIPSQLEFRVGQKQELRLETAVSNPLCPLTNRLITYSLQCSKTSEEVQNEECQNSDFINFNRYTGTLIISNAVLQDVGDFTMSVLASADKLGATMVADFKVEISDGCDILATVIMLRQLEPIFYLIGTEPLQRSVVGLFGLDVEFCKQKFIYNVSCVSCQPGTVTMKQESFQVQTDAFEMKGDYIINVEGRSVYSQITMNTTVSLQIEKQCKDLQPVVEQHLEELTYTLGDTSKTVNVFSLSMEQAHCQEFQIIGTSRLFNISSKLVPYVTLTDSQLTVNRISLAEYDLIGNYDFKILFDATQFGQTITLPFKIEIIDAICLEQQLDLQLQEYAAFDIATGDSDFNQFKVARQIAQCPVTLFVDYKCSKSPQDNGNECDSIFHNHLSIHPGIPDGSTNFFNIKYDALHTKLMVGDYTLEFVATDQVRLTQSKNAIVTFNVWDSCAPQKFTVNGNEIRNVVNFDILYDTLKTVELSVEKLLPSCPSDITMALQCGVEGSLQDCTNHEFFSIKKTDEQAFVVDVKASKDEDVGFYTLVVQASDENRGYTSETQFFNVEVTNSCRTNTPSLHYRPEAPQIAYDLRRSDMITLNIAALQTIEECKTKFKLNIACPQSDSSDCNHLEDLYEVVAKPEIDNVWEFNIATENFALQGNHLFSLFTTNEKLKLKSAPVEFSINVFDPCLDQELTIGLEDYEENDIITVNTGALESPVVVPIIISASIPFCFSEDANFEIKCEGVSCDQANQIYSLLKINKQTFMLKVHTDNKELSGLMQLSLVASDNGFGILTKSDAQLMIFELIDPCLSQQIQIEPQFETQDFTSIFRKADSQDFASDQMTESLEIRYEILQGISVYKFEIKPSLLRCRLDLLLETSCTGKACQKNDTIKARLDDSNNMIVTLSIEVSHKSLEGGHSLTFQINDQVNNLQWTWDDFIKLSILDTCSEQLLLRSNFTGTKTEIYHENSQRYSVMIQNKDKERCPADLELQFDCKGVLCASEIANPFDFIIQTDDVSALIYISAFREESIGEYKLTVIASNSENGFSTVPQTLEVSIIPDCVDEQLFYKNNFQNSIKIQNPERPYLIDPQVKSTLINACYAPPLKFTLKTNDSFVFQDLLSNTGALVIFGVEAGDYSFTYEAQSRMNPTVILTLDLEIYIRDIYFQSPFPQSVSLQSGFTSLILYNSSLLQDLKLLENANGLVSIVESNERAGILLRQNNYKLSPGQYWILFQIDGLYPASMLVEVDDDLQNSNELSTLKSISQYWAMDPFEMPMPVASSMVKVAPKKRFVDEAGVLVIDFKEIVKQREDINIDKTVLQLSTEPETAFSWTAILKGEEIKLKLIFEEPEEVSPLDLVEFTHLKIQFLQSDFFLSDNKMKCLVSEGFFIKVPIATPPSYVLRTITDSLIAKIYVIVTLVLILGIVFIGFYFLNDHSNLLWLQIEFLQNFSVLALLVKNEDGKLGSSNFGFLVDLGQLVRLDFFCIIIPKEIPRQGFDRYELYSYSANDGLFWEGLKGPLNVLIWLIIIFFFASLTRLARFYIVTHTKSKKINLAAEAFMIWVFDKFLTVIQLHFMLLSMYGSRSDKPAGGVLLFLLVITHWIGRHVLIFFQVKKIQNKQQLAQLEDDKKHQDQYQFRIRLVPFQGAYRSYWHAHADQMLRSVHNFVFVMLIVFADKTSTQCLGIAILQWLHIFFYAFVKPFRPENKGEFAALACKVALIAAVLDQPRPYLVHIVLILIVILQTSKGILVLSKKLKQWRQVRLKIKLQEQQGKNVKVAPSVEPESQRKLNDDDSFKSESGLDVVEEVSSGAEDDPEINLRSGKRKDKKSALLQSQTSRLKSKRIAISNDPSERIQTEEFEENSQGTLLKDSQMKVYTYTDQKIPRRRLFLPTDEDGIEEELRNVDDDCLRLETETSQVAKLNFDIDSDCKLRSQTQTIGLSGNNKAFEGHKIHLLSTIQPSDRGLNEELEAAGIGKNYEISGELSDSETNRYKTNFKSARMPGPGTSPIEFESSPMIGFMDQPNNDRNSLQRGSVTSIRKNDRDVMRRRTEQHADQRRESFFSTAQLEQQLKDMDQKRDQFWFQTREEYEKRMKKEAEEREEFLRQQKESQEEFEKRQSERLKRRVNADEEAKALFGLKRQNNIHMAGKPKRRPTKASHFQSKSPAKSAFYQSPTQ